MNTSSETFLTVREHADALAHELHPKAWRKYRNEPLNQLLPAIWLDEFEDEKTWCLLSSPNDVENCKKGYKPAPGSSSVRTLLYGILPKGELWVPEAVRKAHGEYLWGELAALAWDDYEKNWLHNIILYGVVIPGSDFEKWKARHWRGKKETRGRKKGSGSYEALDASLVEDMKQIIADGTALSRYAAGMKVAPRAEGPGTLESKAKRLVRRFSAEFD